MSYRLRTEERDFSGFAITQTNETGAIVVKSRKGKKTPIFCENETDIITHFGKPDAENFGVFEAIDFCRQSPSWIVSAVGANFKYAGVDVQTSAVVSFGTRSGRILETFNESSYSNVDINATHLEDSVGDGLENTFTGTITDTTTLPIKSGSVKIKVGLDYVDATDGDPNTLVGSAISSGSLNKTTGTYNIIFAGTPGTVANYTTTVDLSSGVNLSIGGTDKKVNLTIDGVIYENVNFGSATGTSRTDIITIINTTVGYIAAITSGSNFITISGQLGSASLGQVRIDPPTSGSSALNLIFDAAAVFIDSRNGTNPTGSIPKVGEKVVLDYLYTKDISSITSHTIFTVSPWDDSYQQLAVKIKNISGTKQYQLTLYDVQTVGLVELDNFVYSLIREKDAFGKSLYYVDIFDDHAYLTIFINPNYSGVASPVEDTVNLTGGVRGDDPLGSNYLDAWNNFQKKTKFPAKIFMDVYGNSANTILNIIRTYQEFAFGITVVPLGNSRAEAITFKNGLGIDDDSIAIYTNWSKIEDPYNNSFAFTSNVGKIGAKYAAMEDVFDALSPAGIDENGHGGSIGSIGFRIIEVENDYSDADLEALDNARINPIVFDEEFGPIIEGDRTMQVLNSDTSFIGTRRLYNFMLDAITKQILRKQEFKLNDELHRLLAKTQTEVFLQPILAQNLLREVFVQCDDKNNNDAVLDQRRFILDIFVKVTPNSQFVLLRLTRLSQTQVLADFIIQ